MGTDRGSNTFEESVLDRSTASVGNEPAEIPLEDESAEMSPGSPCDIPVSGRHRVQWTTPAGPTIRPAIHS